MIASLLLLALAQAPQPWVPAETDQAEQTCGPDAHRHSLKLDAKGNYVVEREKGEPDIVFDGKCHSNDNSERVTDEPRKVLPVPKKDSRDL